jgi:hypothetical protein
MKSRQISLYQNNQYSKPLQAREDFFSPNYWIKYMDALNVQSQVPFQFFSWWDPMKIYSVVLKLDKQDSWAKAVTGIF